MDADGYWRWRTIFAASLLLCPIWFLAFYALGNEGGMATAVLLSALACATWFCRSSLRGGGSSLLTILAAALFFLPLWYRTDNRTVGAQGDVGLDLQNGAKIIFWLAMAGAAILHYRAVVSLLLTPAVRCFVLFCCAAMLSTTYSYSPAVTAASAFGIASYLAFSCLVAAKVAEEKVYSTALYALLVLAAVNVASAVLLPTIAYMPSESDMGVTIGNMHLDDITDERFCGLTGHPNQLGVIASVTLLLGVVCWHRRFTSRISAAIAIALAAGLLYASRSRTAAVAASLALVLQLPKRVTVCGFVVVAVAALALVLSGQSDTVFSWIGRGGDTQELATLAGRTDLWQFTVTAIADHPLIGHGYNSFETYAARFWSGSNYQTLSGTHNNYLEALFTTGLIGTIPLLLGFGLLIYYWLKRPYLPRDVFIVFLVPYGLTEADLPTIAVLPTLMLFLPMAIDARLQLVEPR